MRLLWLITAACVVIVLLACGHWIVVNPLPSYYDEAVYANNQINTVAATQSRGLRGFLDAYWRADVFRPPAERLLAFPFALLFGPHLLLLRAISILGFLFATLWLAATARFAAGDTAGTLTILVALASPVLILSAKMYGTEYPLLLALAGTLWCLTVRPTWWPLLGVCIGIGLLAKVSYIVCVGPILFLAIVGGRRWPDIARPRAIAAATLLGALIASTWWIRDGVIAWRYAQIAVTLAQHTLGPWKSPQTLVRFVRETARCGTGYGMAVAALATLGWMAIRRPHALRRQAEAVLVLLLAGALPPPLLSYFGGTHNPRYLAPALFLWSGAVAIAAASRTRLAWVVGALAVLQIVLMTFPRTEVYDNRSYIWRGVTEVMSPIEQWDWSRLRDLADAHGQRRTVVAIKGTGYALNSPQILYAWGEAHRPVSVVELNEDPMAAVEHAARVAQVVVTVPGYRGEPSDAQVPLNLGNDAFAAAMERDSRFERVRLDVGLRETAMVEVFFRRPPGTRAPAE